MGQPAGHLPQSLDGGVFVKILPIVHGPGPQVQALRFQMNAGDVNLCNHFIISFVGRMALPPPKHLRFAYGLDGCCMTT